MAKATYPVPKSNPNLKMSIIFLILWIVNGLVISLANMIFPQQIVLGTMSLSRMMALVLSSGVLAWLATITMPLFTEVEIRKQMVLAPQHWMAGYLVINAISVWVVARFADALGLGIESWMYVLGLAVVLDVTQGMAMMLHGEAQQKK
jgi:hypothetical protein